jgi:hypothetical protein
MMAAAHRKAETTEHESDWRSVSQPSSSYCSLQRPGSAYACHLRVFIARRGAKTGQLQGGPKLATNNNLPPTLVLGLGE